jgi:hypothetical protein
MTKSAPSHPGSGRPGASKALKQPNSDEPVDPKASSQPKKMKVFFSDVDTLLAKRASQESRLKDLQGPANKRKRANCFKVIMQINRAIKNADKCIKSPDELRKKRIQEKVKRIAKKLEKKRMHTIKREVKQVETEYYQ